MHLTLAISHLFFPRSMAGRSYSRFFFSSRRRHTRWNCDWSSDVCSSDLVRAAGHYGIVYPSLRHPGGTCLVALVPHAVQSVTQGRVIRLTWSGTPGAVVSVLESA